MEDNFFLNLFFDGTENIDMPTQIDSAAADEILSRILTSVRFEALNNLLSESNSHHTAKRISPRLQSARHASVLMC